MAFRLSSAIATCEFKSRNMLNTICIGQELDVLDQQRL